MDGEQVLSKANFNYTPLRDNIVNERDHAKKGALNAWKRVIHRTKKTKSEPKSVAVIAQKPTMQEKKLSPRKPLFPDIYGFLSGKGKKNISHEQREPVQKEELPKESIRDNSVHILTAGEYTPDNPSPDYLKGQHVGYVKAKETLEDGSKLWPLDWSLSPIDPSDMVYNLPGQRSVGSFRAAVHHLNLGHPDNGRYAQVEDVDRTITFCNVAASDMADMFQISHVFSRFDENGAPMLANTMNDRIIAEANRKDAEPSVSLVTREEAQQIADMGYPVFLSIKKERRTPNANYMNGHIGLVTPRSMLDTHNPDHRKQGIYLTQAGSESGDAIYFDEREKYNEANGYLKPIFAVDTRDLQDARAKKAVQEIKPPSPTGA